MKVIWVFFLNKETLLLLQGFSSFFYFFLSLFHHLCFFFFFFLASIDFGAIFEYGGSYRSDLRLPNWQAVKKNTDSQSLFETNFGHRVSRSQTSEKQH